MAISGLNGNVKVASNTVAQISSWEFNPTKKMLNYVNFGDTWEHNVPSTGSADVKLTGFWIGSDTNGQTVIQNAFLNNTLLAFELDIDGTHKWTFNGYVATMPQKAQVDALITQDFDVKMDGAPTYA